MIEIFFVGFLPAVVAQVGVKGAITRQSIFDENQGFQEGFSPKMSACLRVSFYILEVLSMDYNPTKNQGGISRNDCDRRGSFRDL